MNNICIICQESKTECECTEEIMEWCIDHERRLQILEAKFALFSSPNDMIDNYLMKACNEA
jgi:hypothetical protein